MGSLVLVHQKKMRQQNLCPIRMTLYHPPDLSHLPNSPLSWMILATKHLPESWSGEEETSSFGFYLNPGHGGGRGKSGQPRLVALHRNVSTSFAE